MENRNWPPTISIDWDDKNVNLFTIFANEVILRLNKLQMMSSEPHSPTKTWYILSVHRDISVLILTVIMHKLNFCPSSFNPSKELHAESEGASKDQLNTQLIVGSVGLGVDLSVFSNSILNSSPVVSGVSYVSMRFA